MYYIYVVDLSCVTAKIYEKNRKQMLNKVRILQKHYKTSAIDKAIAVTQQHGLLTFIITLCYFKYIINISLINISLLFSFNRDFFNSLIFPFLVMCCMFLANLGVCQD